MRRSRSLGGLFGLVLPCACAPSPTPSETQLTMVEPGIEAEDRGDYGFALFTYRYWANFDSSLAQYRLGRLYGQGLGAPRDFAEAARLYRAASDIGYPPAHAALAAMYEQGRGVERDDAKARVLYRKAADGRRAVSLLEASAADGIVGAHVALGDLYAKATWWRGTRPRPSVGTVRERERAMPRPRSGSPRLSSAEEACLRIWSRRWHGTSSRPGSAIPPQRPGPRRLATSCRRWRCGRPAAPRPPAAGGRSCGGGLAAALGRRSRAV